MQRDEVKGWSSTSKSWIRRLFYVEKFMNEHFEGCSQHTQVTVRAEMHDAIKEKPIAAPMTEKRTPP